LVILMYQFFSVLTLSGHGLNRSSVSFSHCKSKT
jgi:hypothetical protein